MEFSNATRPEGRLDEEEFAALSEPEKERYLDALPNFDPDFDQDG